MIDQFIFFDKKIMIFLNNLGNNDFDAFWILVSEKWFWIPLYVIFIYLLFKNFNKKSFLYIVLFAVLGITASDQVANIFKISFHRLRPCHDPTLEGLIREVKCGGRYGFYSAHAANAFFTATFIGVLLKSKIKYFLYFLFAWASIVAYSRIYLGVHFPGDVFFGGVMGILLGLFFVRLTLKVIRRSENPYSL